MDKENNKEKRSDERVSCSHDAEFTLAHSKSQGGCRITDLSSKGMRLEFAQPVMLHEVLYLVLKFDKDNVFHCLGKLVWVKENVKKNLYEAGLEITNILATPQCENPKMIAVGLTDKEVSEAILSGNRQYHVDIEQIGQATYLVLSQA